MVASERRDTVTVEATRERLWMGWLTEAHGYLENTEFVYVRDADEAEARLSLDLLAQVNRRYAGPENLLDPSRVTKPMYWTDGEESAICVEYVHEVEGLRINGVLYVPATHTHTPASARAEYEERVTEWADARRNIP